MYKSFCGAGDLNRRSAQMRLSEPWRKSRDRAHCHLCPVAMTNLDLYVLWGDFWKKWEKNDFGHVLQGNVPFFTHQCFYSYPDPSFLGDNDPRLSIRLMLTDLAMSPIHELLQGISRIYPSSTLNLLLFLEFVLSSDFPLLHIRITWLTPELPKSSL